MLTSATHEALIALSTQYARLADDREFDAMASLFGASGILEPAPGVQRVGPAAIADALQGLMRFDRTFHLLGQIEIEDTDPPAGHTYCIAHHFTNASTADTGHTGVTDHVMYIRYNDAFIHEAGHWRFAHRRLDTVWAGQEPKT